MIIFGTTLGPKYPLFRVLHPSLNKTNEQKANKQTKQKHKKVHTKKKTKNKKKNMVWACPLCKIFDCYIN